MALAGGPAGASGSPAERPCTCSRAWPCPPTGRAPLSAPGAAAKGSPGLVASRQSLPGPALRSDSDEHPSITPVINSASDGLWLLETQGCCLVVGSVPDALIPSAVCRRPHRVHRAVAAATALPALCLTIHFNPRSASDHSLPLAWRPSSSSCALPGPCPSVSVLSTRSDLGTWFWFVVGPPRPPSLSGAAARAGLPWGNAHGQGGGPHPHSTRDPCGSHS